MEQPPHKPTGRTGVVIVPPRDICGFIDHYRHLYIPDEVRRIEPHISVFGPWVPFDQLPQAILRLAEVVAAHPKFPAAIRGFDRFLEEGILYMRLAHPEHVISLYREILAEFPGYPAYGGQYGDDLVPHITIGKFDDPQELEKVFQELSEQRLFIAWDVESVIVKYEGNDDHWHTWAEVSLDVHNGNG